MSYRSAVLADTPAGYWRLGELSGTTAADSSGNARNGTYSGTYTLGASTVLADGDAGVTLPSTGYVTMGDVAAFEFTGAFSADGWFKTTAAGGQALVGKFAAANSGWLVFMVAGGTLRFLAFTAASVSVFSFDTTLTYNDGFWHHFGCTWDGTTGANKVQIYVDGVVVKQGTASAGTPGTGTDPFVIGAYAATFISKFTGSLDDVAVYSSELTPTRILAHYQERTKATTSVFVNSVDRSTLSRLQDSEILDQLNEAPNTATVVVRGFTPEIGQTLEIKTETTTIFKGLVTDRTQLQANSAARKRYRLEANDHTYLLDRRLVNHDYTSQQANSIAYSLIASYATGFTGTNIATGLTVVDLPNKMETVSQALTRLANLAGALWYVDYADDVHFRVTEVLGNPQPLDTTKIFPYRDFSYTRKLPQVTRVYVEGQGTTTRVRRAAGQTTIPIVDDVPFSSSGGGAIAGSQVLTYTGLGTSTIPNGNWQLIVADAAGLYQGLAWSPTLGIFAAVGFSAAQSSPDGLIWTTRSASEANNWTAVCWSPEQAKFVAVAATGTHRVMTSTNGTSWTNQTASQANSWAGVCWAADLSLFVAVAQDGVNRVMTSPDGVTWTNRTASSAQFWTAVCWSPDLSLLVAVANSGAGTTRVMTSSNGTAWTDRTHASFAAYGCVWADALGLFIVTGATNVMTSPDGTTWTIGNIVSSRTFIGCAWAPELRQVLILAGAASSITDGIWVSSDGVQWTQQTQPSAASSWNPVAWAGELGRYVTLNAGGAATYGVMVSIGDEVSQLEGIPASGTGSIVTAIPEGSDINLLVTRNDATAQTALAALEGGDGIHETYIQDRRLSEEGATARGDGELALGKDESDMLTVTSEDPFMIAGRTVTVNISGISVTLRIQQVRIGWDRGRLLPQRYVTASNVFKTLYQYLRDLDDRSSVS